MRNATVDVNKNIGITIKEDKTNDFWWFNNGITVIASECRPFQKSLFLEDVQIINGLQTSFTIYEHRADLEEDDKRALLVKVILTSDKRVVDKVIHSSNFQNPVPPVLLRATDSTQRDIETFCLSKGYFYDRRKGFYKGQNKPANRIFTIQDMAQAIEAILFFNPSAARKNPTTIIKTDKSYTRIFDKNKDFKAYLNCILIVRRIKKYIGTSISGAERGLARNLTYHVSRVLASCLINKVKYNSNDIAELRIDDLDVSSLSSAFQTVTDNLIKYQNQTGENLINIAKSKKFDEFLTNELSNTPTVSCLPQAP